MLKLLLSALSPAGRKARLSILIFHRVFAKPDPLFPDEVDAARFDNICRWLRDWFNVLPLDEAVRRLADRRLPACAAAITFDDGYADNHDVALPILLRHGLPATFFIASGFLDGGRMWNDTIIEAVRRTRERELCLQPPVAPHAGQTVADSASSGLWHLPVGSTEDRRRALAALIRGAKYLPHLQRVALAGQVAAAAKADLTNDLMMRATQVVALHRAGMQIGAHTVSHPIMSALDDDQARAELTANRDMLQALLQAPVTLFAYPNGQPDIDWTARTAELVREVGFTAAVSTAWGAARHDTSLYALPRFTPWDLGRMRFGLSLARNLIAA